MNCKYCGAELNADELFCYRCGKTVTPEPVERHCGLCGAELEPEAAFCWKCGRAAQTAEQPKTAQKTSKVQKATPAAPSTTAAARTDADAKADLKHKTEVLVLAAQNGDSDSFTELYQLYYQKVFALAKTTVHSDADAEDVLQLTFVKAWNNLGKLKNASAFSTWIQRITLNQCYSLLRKKHVTVSLDSDDEDAEPIQIESDLMLPEAYAERSDLKARLGKIIGELSAVQQQTITLYYFDGLPVENIAWIMDCSVNTVKSRLFLARKSIKTEIEEQERKSGQPFCGVAGLGAVPFGKLFLGQMEASALPQATAAEVLEAITQQIAAGAAKATGQAAVGKATAKGAAKVGAKAAAKTAAKTAAGAVTKKILTGVVAGLLAAGAVTGGTVAAVGAVKNRQAQAAAQTETVSDFAWGGQTETGSGYTWDAEGDSAGTNDPKQKKLQAVYRAYLDCLIENKAGIDNYIWQIWDWENFYTVDDATNRLVPMEEPTTDDKRTVPRSVVVYDINGDSIPELLYIGDVSSPVKFTSVSTLNVLTYRDGTLVSLYSGEWDHPEYEEFTMAHSLWVRPDGTLVFYHAEGATFDSLDSYEVFAQQADGTLRREFALEYCYDSFDHEEIDERLPVIETYRGAGGVSISKAEYEARLAEVLPQDSVRLFDRYGYAPFAMTADEVIAYLEQQLGMDSAAGSVFSMTESPYYVTTFTSSSGNIGNATVELKKGFDFLRTDSSEPNYELALTAITLSAQVYKNAQGRQTVEILKGLGYDKTDFSNGDSSFAHPGVCFGYKKLDDGKNLFTAVVRGTDTTNDLTDVWTDLQDGTFSMFRVSGEYIEGQLEAFMKKATGKTIAELKREDNYFFFTGHSLGGAVANYLSINGNVMELAGSDKGKIYTYTFESPHTCVNLLWDNPETKSNARNYKVDGDAVTNVPPYMGSTTYGKDVWIRVSELDDDLYRKLFPDAKSKTLADATSVDGHGDAFGLHDVCLNLLKVMQDLTCVDLPAGMPKEFWQASGAGAWGEEIILDRNGVIYGSYHDTDAGWDGDGFDSTVMLSRYTVRFGEVRRINSFTYSFVVERVDYENEIDSEEIVRDGYERVRYLYTGSSFKEGSIVTLYTDKTPAKAVPEDTMELYEMATVTKVSGTLPCYVLRCEQTHGSFYGD